MKIRGIFKQIKLGAYVKAFLLTVFVLVGFIFIGKFIQADPTVKGFDRYVYELIHGGPHNAFFDLIIRPFNFNFLPWGGTMPSYFYFMLGFFFLYLALFNRKVLGWAVLAIVIGLLVDREITSLHWHYVQRDRPFTMLPNTVDDFGQRAWRGWNSFPSGHARETALFATIIAAFLPRTRWVMLGFTLFIAWSRLYLGAHFPTDVISGLLIGYLLAKVALILIGELQVIYKVVRGRRYAAATQDPGEIDSQQI